MFPVSPWAAILEPSPVEAPVTTADGATARAVYVVQNEVGATISVLLDAGALPDGEHGIHVHETGNRAQGGNGAFAMAKAHDNPTGQKHGAPNADSSNAGDLGNLIAGQDGTSAVTITVTTVSHEPSASDSLQEADRSALIIHVDVHGLKTGLSGKRGDRILCVVPSPGAVATPGAARARPEWQLRPVERRPSTFHDRADGSTRSRFLLFAVAQRPTAHIDMNERRLQRCG